MRAHSCLKGGTRGGQGGEGGGRERQGWRAEKWWLDALRFEALKLSWEGGGCSSGDAGRRRSGAGPSCRGNIRAMSNGS